MAQYKSKNYGYTKVKKLTPEAQKEFNKPTPSPAPVSSSSQGGGGVPNYDSFAPQPLPQSNHTPPSGGSAGGELPTQLAQNVPIPRQTTTGPAYENVVPPSKITKAPLVHRAAEFMAPEGVHGKQALLLGTIAALPNPSTAVKGVSAAELALQKGTKALGQKLTPNLEKAILADLEAEQLSKIGRKYALEEANNAIGQVQKYGTKLSALPNLYWEKFTKAVTQRAAAREAQKATTDNLYLIYDKATEKRLAILARNLKISPGQIEKKIKSELLWKEVKEGMDKALQNTGFLTKHWNVIAKTSKIIGAAAVITTGAGLTSWLIADNIMTQASVTASNLLERVKWDKMNPVDAYEHMKDREGLMENAIKTLRWTTSMSPALLPWRKMWIESAMATQSDTLLNIQQLKEQAEGAQTQGLASSDKMMKESDNAMKTWIEKVKEFLEEHPEGSADMGEGRKPEDFQNIVTTPSGEGNDLYWQEQQLRENQLAREEQEQTEANQQRYEDYNTMDFERKQQAEEEMQKYYADQLAAKQASEEETRQFWLDYQARKEAYWQEYQRKKQEEAPSKLTFGLL